LILSDPTAKALADRGSDNECATRCVEIAPLDVVDVIADERTVLGAFTDPREGETVLQALEQAAAANQLVARAMRWLEPQSAGLPVGTPAVRAMVQSMVGTVLTAEQATTLLRIAERPATVSANDVSAAWYRYRPDGVIQGV